MAQDAPLPQALGVPPSARDDDIFMNLQYSGNNNNSSTGKTRQRHQIAQRRASTGTVMTEAETAASSSPSSSIRFSPTAEDGGQHLQADQQQPQAQQPRRRSMLAERRVSFSGTDRVREFNLGDSERRMKIEAKRESKKARKQFKSQGEKIDISASADDIVPDDHPDHLADDEKAAGAAGSGAAAGADAAPLPSALRKAYSSNDEPLQRQQQQEYGDPNMFDDPFSAERVVSSLFTSLISTTSSGAASASASASASARSEPKRRSSHDGITTAMSVMDMGDGEDVGSSTSSANILAAARQRRRASIAEERARRRSLDLWSAPAGTARLTTTTSNTIASATTSATTSASTSTAAAAAGTNTNTNTVGAQPTRTAQRRSSLELWSAPAAKKRTATSAATTSTGMAIDRSAPPTTLLRRASGDAIGGGRRSSIGSTTNAPNTNHRPMEGLAQLRLMSAASRRLSPSGGVGVGSGGAAATRRRNSMMAAAPTTGIATTFTMPLNDADADNGTSRRRSSTSASRRRHSLGALTRATDMILGDDSDDIGFGDVEPMVGRFTTERGGNKDVVIINGKRIQRRTMARRRTSLEMEDEPNAADVLDYMCEPQSSRSHLVLMDSETRRQVVKTDAQRDRAARRRHSITLTPCNGWMDASYVETTFTNDTGTLGLRRTQSFDGSVLPSAIFAKKVATERDFSEDINCRKGREDLIAATVGTPDTELSSDEHALDGASLHGDVDDNSACRTASSSCVAVRRGSQEQHLHKEDGASALPPLNITIHQRRRPSSEATINADPRQRRSSDSDVGKPPARRTSADRTVGNLFTMKSARRELPRRRLSRSAVETEDASGSSVPQQEGRRGRQNRTQRNHQQQQQQQQQQKHSTLASSSGVYSQSRRRHSMGALSSFLTWHREEKLPEGDSGDSTDAIAETEPTEDKLPKSNSLSDIQLGLAMELIQDTEGRGNTTHKVNS